MPDRLVVGVLVKGVADRDDGGCLRGNGQPPFVAPRAPLRESQSRRSARATAEGVKSGRLVAASQLFSMSTRLAAIPSRLLPSDTDAATDPRAAGRTLDRTP